MKNGNKKGVSIVDVGWVHTDTCNVERNGDLSLSRTLIVDLELAEDAEFRHEQYMSFQNYIETSIVREWGPIKKQTDCVFDVLPMTELRGDSKTTKICVTFKATVFARKEVVKYGKQLSLSC